VKRAKDTAWTLRTQPTGTQAQSEERLTTYAKLWRGQSSTGIMSESQATLGRYLTPSRRAGESLRRIVALKGGHLPHLLGGGARPAPDAADMAC